MKRNNKNINVIFLSVRGKCDASRVVIIIIMIVVVVVVKQNRQRSVLNLSKLNYTWLLEMAGVCVLSAYMNKRPNYKKKIMMHKWKQLVSESVRCEKIRVLAIGIEKDLKPNTNIFTIFPKECKSELEKKSIFDVYSKRHWFRSAMMYSHCTYAYTSFELMFKCAELENKYCYLGLSTIKKCGAHYWKNQNRNLHQAQ